MCWSNTIIDSSQSAGTVRTEKITDCANWKLPSHAAFTTGSISASFPICVLSKVGPALISYGLVGQRNTVITKYDRGVCGADLATNYDMVKRGLAQF